MAAARPVDLKARGDSEASSDALQGDEIDLPLHDEPDSLVDVNVALERPPFASEAPEERTPRVKVDLSALDRDLEGMGLRSNTPSPTTADELADELVDTEDEPSSEWDAADSVSSPLPSPVSRPARAGERAGAAAVDLALMAILGGTVVYFTSRVARVSIAGLLPAAPWIGVWILGVGLCYAAFFTGTTGQTLGKIATGLRVVDATNRPPGYARALLRALAGLVGVLLGGAGLVPFVFDPARRTLHDRFFRTRVVRG
jgi:uncharacterized RDD family membrane protein YckC